MRKNKMEVLEWMQKLEEKNDEYLVNLLHLRKKKKLKNEKYIL